jgi:metal-responsive CopG/Arc/MetJ family transcriptional regulator
LEHTVAKVKVSVTIEESVLERVDRFSRETSRSEIVERALTGWLHDQRRRALEEEVAAYYRSRSAEEEADDREWAELSSSRIGKSWK